MSVCRNKDECIGMKSMKSRAISAIRDVPAADVRENERGEWIPIDELPWDEANTFLCSACNSECDTHNGDYDLPYFCPNCGADMRGEKDG